MSEAKADHGPSSDRPPIALASLVANLAEHLRNPGGSERPVYANVRGEIVPITLGGVSTYGDTVMLFVAPPSYPSRR
jgi:hypothetical protein